MFRPTSSGGRSRPAAALLGAAVLAGVTAPAAFAAEPAVIDATAKVAPAASFDRAISAAKADKGGSTRVIVGLQARFDPAEATSTAKAAALGDRLAPARDRVLGALKGQDFRVVRTFDTVPYVSLELSASALAALKASGAAASITEEQYVKPALAETTQIIESAPENVRGYDGTGQVIAVLDTGIDSSHPFFAGRIVEESCFSDNPTCPNGQTTQFGPGAAVHTGSDHGTIVAGVAAGQRAAGGTFDGVAPNAKIMPVQIFAPGGGPSGTVMMAALDHVLARANAGVKIAAVNISAAGSLYTADCDYFGIKASIDALRAKGIPTVIASGNSGSSTGVGYPSCISTAITVGAVTETDDVIYDASPQVELLGHGDNVTTSVAGGGYGTTGGTSTAAPHVAGAWALYAQRFPGTSVTDALAAFQRGGKTVVDTRSGTPVPLKRLNVAGAFARWGYVLGAAPTNPAYTPTPTLQGNSTGGVNTITRTAVGTYKVTFPNLGSGLEGNAQARSYLGGTNRCKVRSLGTSGGGNDTFVTVACVTPAGVAVDQRFIVTFENDETKRSSKGGYVTSLQATASHTPAASLQANSTGATNTVGRISAGRYAVDFPGFATGTAGVPHVTPVGSDGRTCQITTWFYTTVGVSCRNTAGIETDTPFTLTYDHLSVFGGGAGGYIYANNKTATTAYSPVSGYRWNSTGATNTSVKTATGSYSVNIPGLATTNAVVMVTAVDSSAAVQCNTDHWLAGPVLVKCVDAAGAPVDSNFTVSYSTPV